MNDWPSEAPLSEQWNGPSIVTGQGADGKGERSAIIAAMAAPPPPATAFCSACGSARIARRVPEGDNMPRFVCGDCGTIHYQNPKIVVGCLPEIEQRVLLCKRAIEPRHGLWTLPAGFLENGESIFAGALRETLEEANARVEIGDLYTMISLPQISQVYVMFRARLLDLDFGPGPESLEVRLFEEHEVPWEELAFRTIGRTLRNYFLDRKRGAFQTRVSTLVRRPSRPDVSGAA
jgi:ADP-ribose pyrophosphatase YjhB (NUDIX family)